MKKFYAITLACILCTASLFAQTYRWIGPSTGAGGNWNDAANWEVSGGGSGFPNGNVDVLFDQAALVNVNVAAITANTIKVTNSVSVKLFSATPVVLSVTSANIAAPALQVDAGSTLLDSTSGTGDNGSFELAFVPNAKGLINGTWAFRSADKTSDGPFYSLPVAGSSNRIDINGTIYVGPNAHGVSITSGDSYIFMSSTAIYHLDCDGGSIPRANYDANTLIQITGLVTSGTSYSGNKPLGRVVINCPNITAPLISLALQNAKIQGNFDVLNTNDQELQIVGNGSNASTIRDTILGNLNISGTSKVVVSRLSNSNNQIFLYVYGNLNAGGTRFDLQRNNNGSANSATTLVLKGNLNHTAGIFTTSATNGDVNQELFIVEMNGTAAQTISSVTGSIDNSINEMTLRLNNSAGVTLLTPLAVGRLSFNSTNKGVLTTTAANRLTINNTVASTLTVNSPSNTGYVDGPMRRKTATLTAYLFPVGRGGVLRSCEVIPTTFTTSTYEAEYFNTGYPDLTIADPLSGISNAEYWNIVKIGGSDAAVRLRLLGQVPGATGNDVIVPAHYNGTDWEDVHVTTGSGTRPGDATTGTVQSTDMTTFSPFSLGWVSRAALPIILVSFDARKLSGDNALLTWEVTGNSTPDNFEVLRSADGRNFNSIGVVTASHSLTYSLTDNNLPSGTSYYKLKMTDRDGSVTYSKVIAVLNGNTRMLITSLAPTIVTTGITRVNISATIRANLLLVVTDMHGRIVQQYRSALVPGTQEILLNVMPLSRGTYQVTGYLDGERSATMRFVKQ